MTDKPPHILVIPEARDDFLGWFIECPYTGLVKGVADEEGRRHDCAYLVHCGCQELYSAERDRFEKEYDGELEVYDWLEGYDNSRQLNSTMTNPLIPRTYPAHKTCPETGLEHHTWEGEIMTSTGPCGVANTFDDLRREYMEQLGEHPPGRHRVRWSWDEDGMELEIVE